MKNIYYLYSYDTGELLMTTTNKKEYYKIWDQFENDGINCYGVDYKSKVNNIKIGLKEMGL